MVSLPHVVLAENAELIWSWLQERGGLVVWESHDLSSPASSVTTPLRNADGTEKGSPGWRYPEPTLRITDPANVVVEEVRVLATVPIRLVKGSGLRVDVSKASGHKMDRLVLKYRAQHPGKEVWWSPTGDLLDHTAQVLVAGTRTPITEYMTHPVATPSGA